MPIIVLTDLKFINSLNHHTHTHTHTNMKQTYYYYPHVTDEEIKAQNVQLICYRSQLVRGQS